MDLGRPDGNTFNIDVGSAAKYEAGHVAGARSIPIDVLPPRLSESPDGTDVVAY